MNFIRLSLFLGILSGSLVVGAELSPPEKNFETLWKTFYEPSIGSSFRAWGY